MKPSIAGAMFFVMAGVVLAGIRRWADLEDDDTIIADLILMVGTGIVAASSHWRHRDRNRKEQGE